MSDDVDRIPCSDVVCEAGGHKACQPQAEHPDDCAAFHLGYGGYGKCVRHDPKGRRDDRLTDRKATP